MNECNSSSSRMHGRIVNGKAYRTKYHQVQKLALFVIRFQLEFEDLAQCRAPSHSSQNVGGKEPIWVVSRTDSWRAWAAAVPAYIGIRYYFICITVTLPSRGRFRGCCVAVLNPSCVPIYAGTHLRVAHIAMLLEFPHWTDLSSQ